MGTQRNLNATISIGMTTLSDGRSFRGVGELPRAADKVPYAAKPQGRNCGVAFDIIAKRQLA